jgi:hypothetical protein
LQHFTRLVPFQIQEFNMAHPETNKDPRKAVDLPPHGPRNPDPLTDSPGSHPIETGVGAVLGGAASGLAAGAVGGPVGAVIGAIAGGAVAGGLAGKGVGELIDPTTEDNWIRNLLKKQPERASGWEDEAREAYRFGWRSEGRFAGKTFAQVETLLESEWRVQHPSRPWEDNRSHVRDGYEKGRELNGTR